MPKPIDWLQRAKQRYPDLDFERTEVEGVGHYKVKCRTHGITEVVGDRKLCDNKKKSGCPACSREIQRQSLTKWTTESLVAHLRSVHGDEYDYSTVKYTTYSGPVTITCRKHGPWDSTILAQTTKGSKAKKLGQGCPECWNERRSKNVTIEHLVEANERVHGGAYDLSKITEITSWDQQLEVGCPKHGIFQVGRAPFIAGSGCPCCYRDHKIVIRGREFQVQGYERFALEGILNDNDLHVDDIFEGKHPVKEKRPPRIDYKFEGQWRSHYPDFWIPKLNTLIEIKSEYTAGLSKRDSDADLKRRQLRAKKKFSEAAGYKYVIFVVELNKGRTKVQKFEP